tara:strand:- start:676 stop:1209 length:534 start_codon:yes stop_codon:yes gene_type:complete
MAMTLITTNTSSGDASSDFTASIDSTYKLYIFKFYDVNPATDDVYFRFQGSTNGGSSYGVTKTTTFFESRHLEDDSVATLAYLTNAHRAQSTGAHSIVFGVGSGADESCAGELFLFNPSNTTYMKHFYSTMNVYLYSNGSAQDFTAGYFNTTSAINAMQFATSSGNMDGVIKMYGVG